jgi:hypothetical protein
MSKTNFERNMVLDTMFGDGTYDKPATWYCVMFTVMPTVSTAGTEAAYTGYGPVAKTNNATNFPDAVNGQKSNGTKVTFPERSAGGSDPTVVGFGWKDSDVGGNLRHFAPLTTPKLIGVGDTPEFGIGQLVWQET